MKILRLTFYPDKFATNESPLSTFTSERDLTEPIEEVAKKVGKVGGAAFIIVDIFEAPGDTAWESIPQLVNERMAVRGQIEDDMAIAYHHFTKHLDRVDPRGEIMTTRVAPFGAADCETVLLQCQRHGDWRWHKITMTSNDDATVVLGHDGKVRRL